MKHMEVIQRTWRSVRVRKKVKLFSSLPIDIWKIIVTQIRSPPSLFKNIDTLINIKVVRHNWQPLPVEMKQKLITLRLAKKYTNCLQKSTILNVLRLAMQLLNANTQQIIHTMILNSTIEHFLDVFEAKFYTAQ